MRIRSILIGSIFCSFIVAALFVNLAQADRSEKVNINTATVEELKGLKGIGNTKAEAIDKYREEHGEFSEIDDIKKVSGIGESTFNGIKDNIIVNKDTQEKG